MMNFNYYVLLLCFTFLASCSENFTDLENRIKIQAEKNDKEMSASEIKETASSLIAWGKKDFYQEEIEKFKAADKQLSPDPESILFIGSSSIRFWKTLKQDVSPYKIINRGFGGAHISHVNYHFDEIVKPHAPKAIVFFCGTNDIAALKSVEEVYDDFLDFYSRAKESFPDIKVFVIGIKPSLARLYLQKEELNYNAKIESLSEQDSNLFFIDVWDVMLTEEGNPNPELFIGDGLHINSQGYAIWTKLLMPILEENL